MATDTQIEAYESIKPYLNQLERKIFGIIKVGNGATCWEVMQAIDGRHQTVSGRIATMRKMGVVKDSGRRRENPSTGRKQIVWCPGHEKDTPLPPAYIVRRLSGSTIQVMCPYCNEPEGDSDLPGRESICAFGHPYIIKENPGVQRRLDETGK